MSPINFNIQPEVSIILCTYNRAEFLHECIDSVINQTFKNWELLIVDDGSQDQTFKIANSYVQKFDNIRYLKHKNRKLPYSKNIGVQASFSPYITFIDSDDTYQPEHIEARIEYMKSHPEVDIIQGGFFTEEEIILVDCFNPDRTINIKDCVLGPTFFGKRKVFFELKGFENLSYAEDAEFWARAEKVFNTAKITEPRSYNYSRAENSITKNVFDDFTQTKS